MVTMDPFDKMTELGMRNEAVFQNLLGKIGMGPKKSSIAKALGGGQYAIGDNKIFKLLGVTEDTFLGYDWENGKLSFLKDGQWIAKELHLQISHGVESVLSFNGDWQGGDFSGQKFFGNFQGSSFQGSFASSYKNYASDPSTFVSGTISSFQEGVLGLPKVDVISLDKGSQKKTLSLLEMQVGYYCNLTDDKGVTHSFRLTKCCDSRSMDVELQEETGQKRSIRIPWVEMRKGNDPAVFRRLSMLRIGSRPQIPYLFANDGVGVITNIEISTKGTQFGTTVDTYKLNVDLFRPLRYPRPEVTIHLFTPEEIVRYGKMQQDLSKGLMQYHLRNIQDGLKFKIITGYKGFPHLSFMFNEVEGAGTTDARYAESMRWMDEFVQIIILRMMRSKPSGGAYVSSESGRKVLMNQLTTLVGMPSPAATQPAPAQPATRKRRAMVPEGLRKEVQRLIRDSVQQNDGFKRTI